MILFLYLTSIVLGLMGEEIYFMELEADPKLKLMVTSRHVGFFYREKGNRPPESYLSILPSGQIKSANNLSSGKKFLCNSDVKENNYIGLCLTDNGKDSIFKVVKVNNHSILALDDDPKGGLRIIIPGKYDIHNDYYPLMIIDSHNILEGEKNVRERAYIKLIKYIDGEEKVITDGIAPQISEGFAPATETNPKVKPASQ